MQTPHKGQNTNFALDDDDHLLLQSKNSIILDVEDQNELMDEKENIQKQFCSKIRDFRNPLFDDHAQTPTKASDYIDPLQQDRVKNTTSCNFEKLAPDLHKEQLSNKFQNNYTQNQSNPQKSFDQQQISLTEKNFDAEIRQKGVSESKIQKSQIQTVEKTEVDSMDRLQSIKTSLQRLNQLSQNKLSFKQYSQQNQSFGQQQQNETPSKYKKYEHNIFDSDTKRYQDIIKKYKLKLQKSQYMINQKEGLTNSLNQKSANLIQSQQQGTHIKLQQNYQNNNINNQQQTDKNEQYENSSNVKSFAEQKSQEQNEQYVRSQSKQEYSQLSDAVRELRESIKKHKENSSILFKQFGTGGREQSNAASFCRNQQFSSQQSQKSFSSDS